MVLKRLNRSTPVLNRRPKRTKFKRLHKGRISGFNFKKTNGKLRYGVYGLKILKSIKLRENQILAIKQHLFRHKLLKKKQNNKLWIRGLFDVPVTKKPNEIRMGKGKGSVDHWIMRVKPGKILFELSSMPYFRARRIFKIIRSSIGVPAQMIYLQKSAKKLRFFS